MSLPELKTVRYQEVKIGRKKFKISPWTNRNVIQYENVKDEVIETENFKTDDERRERISEIVFEYLVKPNIDKTSVTLIEREVLFVEMYRISRGNLIPLKYTCTECSATQEIYFDLSRNFKYHPMNVKEFELNNIVFKLRESQLTVDELNEIEEDVNIKYLLSFIQEIEVKGETFKDFTLDEIYAWFMDELDEPTFNDFFDKIIEVIPKIELILDVECENCKHKDKFQFSELPDFSLMGSSKAEE